jgi:hypothetical protein
MAHVNWSGATLLQNRGKANAAYISQSLNAVDGAVRPVVLKATHNDILVSDFKTTLKICPNGTALHCGIGKIKIQDS